MSRTLTHAEHRLNILNPALTDDWVSFPLEQWRTASLKVLKRKGSGCLVVATPTLRHGCKPLVHHRANFFAHAGKHLGKSITEDASNLPNNHLANLVRGHSSVRSAATTAITCRHHTTKERRNQIQGSKSSKLTPYYHSAFWIIRYSFLIHTKSCALDNSSAPIILPTDLV